MSLPLINQSATLARQVRKNVFTFLPKRITPSSNLNGQLGRGRQCHCATSPSPPVYRVNWFYSKSKTEYSPLISASWSGRGRSLNPGMHLAKLVRWTIAFSMTGKMDWYFCFLPSMSRPVFSYKSSYSLGDRDSSFPNTLSWSARCA